MTKWFLDIDELGVTLVFAGKGLRELGQKHLENICVFADTKAEWMIAAQVEICLI